MTYDNENPKLVDISPFLHTSDGTRQLIIGPITEAMLGKTLTLYGLTCTTRISYGITGEETNE